MDHTSKNNFHGVYSSQLNQRLETYAMMRLKPTKPRGKGKPPRRYYSYFRHEGKVIEISLDATEFQKKSAYARLGEILADLERGINPSSARQRIKKIKIQGKISERNETIARLHVYPFFGEYRPRDINRELIEAYIEQRWGLTEDGKLQAVHNTLTKELIVLQMILRTVDRNYKLPKVSYLHKEVKGTLEPLTFSQIEMAEKFVSKKYKAIYWVMAYTAMDISDMVYLKQKDFKNGWIIKKRGKTGNDIKLPVCKKLADKMNGIPTNINPDALLFPNIKPLSVSKNIIRAFKKVGLDGYEAKYLRRFIASKMMDPDIAWIGLGRPWPIQRALN